MLVVLTLFLAVLAILTALKLRQQGPLAPTVPQAEPEAIEGSPAPECQLSFSINLASPSPTPGVSPSPSPKLTPSSTPSPSSSPSPTASHTPSPTATPVATPSPGAQCFALKFYQLTGEINDPA